MSALDHAGTDRIGIRRSPSSDGRAAVVVTKLNDPGQGGELLLDEEEWVDLMRLAMLFAADRRNPS